MSDIHDKHPREDRLQAFLDGDVSRRERRRIEEHVASCTRCTEELAHWRVLFQDLDTLGSLRPSEGFQARVMAGVRLPEELPLAARVRARLAAWIPGLGREASTGGARGGAAVGLDPAGAAGGRRTHLDAGVLQDLAEGVLTGRRAARARTHLEGCTACTAELEGWTSVLTRLSDLERFAPSEGFADRVMASVATAAEGVRAPAAARRSGRARAWSGVLAAARRALPRTRRAWAALAGAAVTPAVTFGLVLYAVFSHPTVTPQALASYAFWQLTDLFVAGWSALLSGMLAVARFAGVDGLIQALLDAPVLAAGGVAVYALGLLLAVRVLYKNLIDSRLIRPRHVSASLS